MEARWGGLKAADGLIDKGLCHPGLNSYPRDFLFRLFIDQLVVLICQLPVNSFKKDFDNI